jgi:hypothetical protein
MPLIAASALRDCKSSGLAPYLHLSWIMYFELSMRMVRSCVGICLSVLAASCASVTAIPLEPDGLTAVPGAQAGFRYYMPRPYLLVTEVPPSTGGGTAPPPAVDVRPNGLSDPAGAPGATPTTPGKQDSTDGGGASASAATAANTNTGYLHSNGTTYLVKLIYLPDYSRPMAVQMDTGLVGTTSMQMNLQDGWMLTSVSANADNSKMADVLTAAISALSSTVGGAGTKASSTSKPPSGPQAAHQAKPDRVLRPGLYAFDYNFGMSRVSFLCAIAYFDSRGSRPADPLTDRGACSSEFARPNPKVISTLY